MSGTFPSSAGTILVDARDFKAAYVIQTLNQADGQKIVGTRFDYTFTPTSTTLKTRYISMSALFTDPTGADAKDIEAIKQVDGFSPNGPVLTPAQFEQVAQNPHWATIDALRMHLRTVIH
ncbi:hypothetical protein ACFQ9X_07345 [Catenulispora yoronensis]